MKNLKHFIIGYYGHGNLGDELILRELLSEKGLDLKNVMVLSKTPKETESKFNVKSIYKFNPFAILYYLFVYKPKVVVGGGSLLQDSTSLRSLMYYLVLVYVSTLLGSSVEIYRNGIGDIKSKIGRYLTKIVLNRVTSISVRDLNSKGLLKDIGVVKDILISEDPVLNMKIPDKNKEQLYSLVRQSGLNVDLINDKFMGIVVKGKNDDFKLKMEMLKLSERLYKDFKIILVIFPFHMNEDVLDFSEEKKALELSKASRGSFETEREFPIINITNKMSDDELLNIYRNMDYIVGERLHSLIVAHTFDIPFISISYDLKIDSFLQSIGASSEFKSTDIINEEILYNTIIKVFSPNENHDSMRNLKKMSFSY